MSIDLTLHQTNASGPLVPATLSKVLAGLAARSVLDHSPRATMHGQEIWIAHELALSDAACAAFLLEFGGQGLRVKGTARGPSAELLAWALHAITAAMKCTLFDANANASANADPEAYRSRAIAYLSTYEADVRATRRAGEAGDRFVAWLARDEHIALAPATGAAVVADALRPCMDDAASLYETLLEHDSVEDVFVSERELASLLARFRARSSS